ncbi:phage/plasmid primase, P4 family [Siminovitchia sediminis]|uniref:Phage/plasmid primase, P4 family n=1 Tax=Siminovitchia sediminis TaxID=1274353 RepID=A0ABW4KNG6_9BACI
MLAAKKTEISLKYDKPINITNFRSAIDIQANNETLTYSAFLSRLVNIKVTRNKGSAGGFVGGFVQNERTNNNTKSRSIVTIDIDTDNPPQNLNVWAEIEGRANFAISLYSTHRHRIKGLRYRGLIPLAKEIEPKHYEEVARFLVDILGINDIGLVVDASSYVVSQLMYYPTCENPNNYEFYYQDAPLFDASLVVKQSKSIPEFKNEKKQDPRGKANWIGAWTSVYSITDVLDNFLHDIYEPFRSDRYTYINGSTKGGVVIYDDNTFAYSNHSTDPISGMNVNSFDLFRLHKFGHLDTEVKHKKITDMPSYKAMVEHCKQDVKVNAFYNEHIRKSVKDDSRLHIIDNSIQGVHPGQFFNEKTFLHHEFACFLVKKENIIQLDDRLHVYIKGRYVADDNLIKRKMINIIPKLKETQLNEVMARLKLIAEVKEHAPTRYIGVKNGVYDLEKDRILNHSPEFVITNQINAKYDPSAMCAHIDNLFSTISDNNLEIEQLLKEMIGYTLFRENSFEKSFILKGEGGNGKSTLFKAIYAFLGDENISAMSLSELRERFNTGMLHGKLANIGDDIPYTSIKDTSVFKKLTTGDLIKGEYKGENPFQFRNFAKLIFATNRLPRLFDGSQGLKDRLVIVPLNARIRRTHKQDPFFEHKITTEAARSYLLNIGLDALKRLLARGYFTLPKIVRISLQEFEISNNPVIEWLNEYYEDGKDIHGMPVSSAYSDYVNFCENNHYKHILSKKALTTELEQLSYISGRKTVNGKTARVYLKKV